MDRVIVRRQFEALEDVRALGLKAADIATRGDLDDLAVSGVPGAQGSAGPEGPQGPAGAEGDTGSVGPQGVKGDTGETGPKGDTGETGAASTVPGPQGPAGADSTVPGPKGDTGATGTQGAKGDTGAQGTAGAKGDTGSQGPQGPKGDTGAQGSKGDTGAQGTIGTTGAKGDTGSTGPPGPAPAGTGFVHVTTGALDTPVAFGTAAGTIAQGNDSRLSDARTPTAHAASHYSNGTDPIIAPTAATPATTGTMTVSMPSDDGVITITPTGACTFNGSGGKAGARCTLVVTTSGTSSFTLTFGTNFKAAGTLATGTTSGKVFAVSFVCKDGTTWVETGRTAAM